eukprot:TRINITY_DN23998_c0_g1_i2.p1 TRINITY_DN23998_c0_g1~~TRINITY_DN23998_c0_g1_i2.p1  ORF type:complete len:644 (-),score=135.95 TRINITY_DN23998_c0_g1_i2:25-1956(-)
MLLPINRTLATLQLLGQAEQYSPGNLIFFTNSSDILFYNNSASGAGGAIGCFNISDVLLEWYTDGKPSIYQLNTCAAGSGCNLNSLEISTVELTTDNFQFCSNGDAFNITFVTRDVLGSVIAVGNCSEAFNVSNQFNHTYYEVYLKNDNPSVFSLSKEVLSQTFHSLRTADENVLLLEFWQPDWLHGKMQTANITFFNCSPNHSQIPTVIPTSVVPETFIPYIRDFRETETYSTSTTLTSITVFAYFTIVFMHQTTGGEQALAKAQCCCPEFAFYGFPTQANMWDYCQFTALLGLIDSNQLPIYLQAYFNGYAWTLGLIRFPSVSETVAKLNRKLLGLDTSLQVLVVNIKDAFLTILSIYLLIIAILIFVYLMGLIVFRCILPKIRKRVSSDAKLRFKWLQIGLVMRVTMLAVSGLTLTAVYQLSLSSQNALLYTLAAFTLIFIACYLGFGFYKLWSFSKKDLEQKENRLKYGGFYSDYRPERKLFFLVVSCEKMLSSIFLASFTGMKWVQIGLLMVVRCLFVGFLVYFTPYEYVFGQKMNVLLAAMKIFQIFLLMLVIGGFAVDGLSIFLIVLNVLGILMFLSIFVKKVLDQVMAVRSPPTVRSTTSDETTLGSSPHVGNNDKLTVVSVGLSQIDDASKKTS